MSVQFKRRTSGEKRRRASHFALKASKLVECAKCKTKRLPHHACPNCGTYKGKSIFDSFLKSKTSKNKDKEKTKAKEQAK